MGPRIFRVSSQTHQQETPAPLFISRRGQLPNLPAQVAKLMIPCGEKLLLQLPLCEWYILNSNANRQTVDVFAELGTLPVDGVPCAKTLTAQTDAILFLVPRGAASRQSVLDAPGKSLSVRLESPSFKASVTADAVARLHAVLRTDFAISPTDGPLLPVHTKKAGGSSQRRFTRSVQQVRAFFEAAKNTNCSPTSIIGSVQGALDLSARAECVRSVFSIGSPAGLSIDGLYAGEDPKCRDAVVSTVIRTAEEVSYGGLRLLSGCSGAPWDVVAAVRRGVDIIDATFPFDMAESGFATKLAVSAKNGLNRERSGSLAYVNLRDRRWERSSDPIVVDCECFMCKRYSKAYVRHLLEVREMMGTTLLAAHNLWDYLCWFQGLRQAIAEGRFEEFVAGVVGGRIVSEVTAVR